MRPTTALQVKRQQFFAFLNLARSLTRAHKSVRKNIFWTLYFGAAKMVPKRKNCMPRTVVQIAADPSYLYALCNDGQIFRMVNHTWQPMMPIPQDDPPAKSKSATDPFADEQPGG
jgi:hypothetical protein